MSLDDPDPPRRIEGIDKVTGTARYAGDIQANDIGSPLDIAVTVTSSQASSRILAIETAAALALPGVRTIVTHENAPRLRKVISANGAEIGGLLPMQDDRLHYNGQCVAIVVAETLEVAQEAAALVDIRYGPQEDGRAFTLDQAEGRTKPAKRIGAGTSGTAKRGDPDKAFAEADHCVDLNFHTRPHHHNAIEPGAVVAIWHADGGLTVHVPTQFNYGEAMVLGQAFGFGASDRLPKLLAGALGGVELRGKVRVLSTLAGGSFGGKFNNVHVLLAPMAAKVNGRAVKLVLTRKQTFSLMPYRGETRQRVRLAATADGKLTALIHEAVAAKAHAGSFLEPIGENTAMLYACPALRTGHQVAELDLNAPGWMRAPGASIGHFAIESAMDELAYQLGIDPLELRLRNHADKDPQSGHDWSSKSLKACYAAGAEAIGWRVRSPQPGTMRENGRLLGYGMATAMYPDIQMPTAARVTLDREGNAVVRTAAAEIGQGAITALTQIAAEALGFPLSRVRLEWGDSWLPFAGPSVGSTGTRTVGAAIAEAAAAARKALVAKAVRDKASPLRGRRLRDIRIVDGEMVAGDGVSDSVSAVMSRCGPQIERRAVAGRTMGYSRRAKAAFGAQFAKVSIDPDTMAVRVERLVGAFACGRIINPVLARSQLMGGMIWGLGQALLEASEVDPRSGRWINANLAEALVATNADAPDIDLIFIDEHDPDHPLGIKGVGEIGMVGVSAAIANAIFHAMGRRATSLPIRIEHLLD